MSSSRQNRRDFLKSTAIAGGAALTPHWLTGATAQGQEATPSDRHVIGCIGTGDRWNGAIGPQVKRFGDIVAVCDVDKNHREKNGPAKSPAKRPTCTKIIARCSIAKISTS